MANMSYCRFRNTRDDLNDCLDALNEEELLSEDEAKSGRWMFEEFLDFCRDNGIIGSYDSEMVESIFHGLTRGRMTTMSNGYVRWSQWSERGMVGHGTMRKSGMQLHLQRFEVEARKLLSCTGADHVLYGRKLYDENGELEDIRFYLIPMTDEEFDNVAAVNNQQVYAVHKMK